MIVMMYFFVFCFSSRRRHTICALVTGVQTCSSDLSFDPAGGIEAVRIMPGVRREAAPIMTRRRHRQIVERDAPGGRRAAGRHFDIDPPRLTVGLNPFAAQLAADLDQEMAHALPEQPFGGEIDPEPLGDRKSTSRNSSH